MISRYKFVFSLLKYFTFNVSLIWANVTGNIHLLEKEDKVEDEVNLALSAFIFAVSLFFVSENWVAMTTRQRLIMKKEPTLIKIKLKRLKPLFSCMLYTHTHHNKADKVYPVPERVSVLKYGSLKVKIS